jgi:hypothetical protein
MFQIPITKLKNAGVLKVSTNTEMAPVEKELKALSEFFTSACLVGKYSSNSEFERILSEQILYF